MPKKKSKPVEMDHTDDAAAYVEPFEEYGPDAEDDGALSRGPVKEEGLFLRMEDVEGGGARFKDKSGKVIAEAAADGSFRMGTETNSKTILNLNRLDGARLDEAQLAKAMDQSTTMYRENSIYRGLIEACVFFVIGKGFRWKADDEDPRVQKYCKEWWDHNKMDGRDVEIVRKFLKLGEVVLRWFDKDAEGRNAKFPKVRFIPYWRLDSIVGDPEDVENIISYNVLMHKKDSTNGMPETVPVPAKEVQYIKNGDCEDERGEPYFLTSMRPAAWFKDFVSNRVVINRFRTVHVLFKKITGSPGKVTATKTAKKNTADGLSKKMPKAGTTVTHNQGIEYEFKAPNVEANDARWDAQGIRQYICTGAQVPEFILGDASNANYTSSFVAENPFIRQIEYLQDLLEREFQAMFKRVIDHGVKTGALKKESMETIIQESGPVMRRVRKMLCACGLGEATKNGDGMSRKKVKTKRTVTIEWPALLHKNQKEEADTLQTHQSMGVVSAETIATKLNYDYAQEQRRIEQEAEAAQDKFDAQRDAALEDEDEDDDTDGNGKGAGNGKPPAR